eukprot:749891-Hanusia_phi.AAC.7
MPWPRSGMPWQRIMAWAYHWLQVLGQCQCVPSIRRHAASLGYEPGENDERWPPGREAGAGSDNRHG